MDLLAELEMRISGLPGIPAEGIRAAIRHIHRAEKHLQNGRNQGDSDLFNDTIYRTNQAFEGMLKEAARALIDSAPSNLSPYQIEEQLISGNYLTERVRALFQNYRQSWRNPATHDYTLLFREQEALLAIVNVSAFAIVLLDQIVEVAAAKRVAEATIQNAAQTADLPSNFSIKSLAEQLYYLLKIFSKTPLIGDQTKTDAEFIGSLIGFIQTKAPDIKITRQVQISENNQVDLLFAKGEDSVAFLLGGNPATGELREGMVINAISAIDESQIDRCIVFVMPLSYEKDIAAFSIPLEEKEVIMVAEKDIFLAAQADDEPGLVKFEGFYGTAYEFRDHEEGISKL